MFGPAGAAVGHGLANSVATFLGMGSYKVAHNSLLEKPLPSMHSANQSVIVRHREYVTDVVSSATPLGFTAQSYSINPGLVTSFPWLASLASLYQEYEFRGLIYEYVSTSADAIASSTNTALGSVMLATQYRANAPAFTNKVSMLNEYFANDGKPSDDICHPIECDPKENPFQIQYIRSGSIGTNEDIKLYDLGTFYIASVGVQGASVNMGELWISYEVELKKPIAQTAINNVSTLSAHYQSTTAIATAPLNNPFIATGSVDTIGLTVASNQFSFPNNITSRFLVNLTVTGGSATMGTTTTGGNVTIISTENSPGNTTSGALVSYVVSVTPNPTGANTVFFTYTAGTAGFSDLYVTEVPSTFK